MQLLPGTSGFSYKEWKGRFYPEDAKPADWLHYYAQHLPAVEINNSFYRMPSPQVLEGWAAEISSTVQFVIKSPRQITHFRRLRDVEEPLADLQKSLELLGPSQGPVLFQLPPKMPKDLPRLQKFLAQLPNSWRVVVQFGDPRWLEEDVFAALRAENVVLCLTDEENKVTPLVATADWGYVRLRNEKYTPAKLKKWLAQFHELGWGKTYVFFKHEIDAPRLAMSMSLWLPQWRRSGE